MPRKPFPAQSSTLSSAALKQRVLPRYALRGSYRCHFFKRGVNDTYVVENGSSRYYLRVYRHGWRSKREIEAEVDLLRGLRRRRINVSAPQRRKDGGYLCHIQAPEGARYAVLFADTRGAPPRVTDEYCRAYGELLARIHRAADRLEARLDLVERRFHLDLEALVDEPVAGIEPFLAHRKADFDEIRQTGAELRTAVAELLARRRPEYGICHGDPHDDNVHVGRGGELVLFDFDCFGTGWRAYDMAVFLYWRTGLAGWSAEARAQVETSWARFLAGYRRVREPSLAELRAVKHFAAIRHVWLMGFAVRGCEHWGRQAINDGYFDHNLESIRNWVRSPDFCSTS